MIDLRCVPAVIGTVVLAGAWLCLLVVCGPAAAQMTAMGENQYPVFADDRGYEALDRAIEQSVAYYGKLPASRRIAFGPDTYAPKELIAGLKRFARLIQENPPPRVLHAFLRKNARVYAHTERGRPVSVLFTGYYEPVLAGSRKKTDQFPYPIYARPRDLTVPYYDRRTIETTDVMASRAHVIAWVADRVGRFFLHVQGSGQVALDDGTTIRVQFDSTNCRPYRSIGRYLLDEGKMERRDMSMQAIAAYLENHPREMDEILFFNPRYVFFRESETGPVGSLGVLLTPGRSVALDPETSPAGALVFVSTKRPVCQKPGTIDGWVPFSRFMCAQDTGSAISGTKRADLFWGSGAYAQTVAGHLQHPGRLYFLVILPESAAP